MFRGVFAVLFQGVYHFFPTVTPFWLDRHPKIPMSNLLIAESCDENQNIRSNYPTFSNTHT